MKPVDFGFYICKAMNDVGDTESSAKLIDMSKILMSEEQIEEVKKKVEKRLGRKNKPSSRRSSKTQETLSTTSNLLLTSKEHTASSVTMEASLTIGASRSAQTQSSALTQSSMQTQSSVETQSSVQTQSTVQSQSSVHTTSSLRIITKEETIVQEIQGNIVKEIEHTTIQKSYSAADIQILKMSSEVELIMKNLQTKNFGSGQESLRELATIAFLIQQGMSVTDITTLFQTESFPALQTPESQSALVQLLERQGHGKLVSDVLTETTETEVDETYVATAGFRAFMKMIALKHASVEEIILQLAPEDFASQEWKNETQTEV